jgi:hypothetical protein
MTSIYNRTTFMLILYHNWKFTMIVTNCNQISEKYMYNSIGLWFWRHFTYQYSIVLISILILKLVSLKDDTCLPLV